MKLKYVLGATALSLLLAGAAYPQQEQEKEKPTPQQEEKRSEPAKQQPAQKQEQQKQEQKTQQQAAKQQQQEQKQQKNEQKQSEQANKQRQEQQKQLTKQQQEEQKQQQKQQQQVARQQHQGTEQQQRTDHDAGRRIPDDRFRASFGREHHFRVEHVDNRRFHYGGYWFTFTDVWPVGWVYADDFYIDFIDGQYYLIDLSHPGFQLLIVVD
jgi:outer membrane biosynthesis protein TonB